MYRSKLLAACAVLVALWSSPALAYDAATGLSYQVTSETLSGYSRSWKDPWDYDYSGECLWGGWSDIYGYYCIIYEERWYWVGVVGDVYRPDGQLQSSSGGEDWRDAQVNYSETLAAPVGVWTEYGYHYIEGYLLVWYCPAPGYCYPTGGGNFSHNYANTQDSAVVLPVRIEYTMLIPLDHVRMPFPWEKFFDADSAYSYTPGATYRIQQTFVIDTENKSVIQLQNLSGITYGYTPAEPSLSSTASCFRKDCPECPSYIFGRKIVYEGQCKIPGTHSCASPATDLDTMVASVSSSSSTSVAVRFQGDLDNDCVGSLGDFSFAWDISWDNSIAISWDASPQYEVTMDHDGFPQHELRINGALVYVMDPISAGNTPNALASPRDVYTMQSGPVP